MSASTIEQREIALKTAQAQLAAANNALSVAEADRKSRDAERQELLVRISRTEVKAPVSGIVSRRSARLGATASSAGEPLFRIIVRRSDRPRGRRARAVTRPLRRGHARDLASARRRRSRAGPRAAHLRRGRQGEPHRQGAHRALRRFARPHRRLRLRRGRTRAARRRRRAGGRAAARRRAPVFMSCTLAGSRSGS